MHETTLPPGENSPALPRPRWRLECVACEAAFYAYKRAAACPVCGSADVTDGDDE